MSDLLFNPTLEQIASENILSIRAINVCENAQLSNLTEILLFYKTYQSFKNIRNCGSKTDDELITFCQKKIRIQEQLSYKFIDNNISSHIFSSETLNFLLSNDFKYIKDILNYYSHDKTFHKLSGWTVNAEKELYRLIQDSIKNFELPGYQLYPQRSFFEKDLLLEELLYIDNLSVRANNILKNSQLDSINKILDFYYEYGTFKNLRNSGTKTEIEIQLLVKRYLDLLKLDINDSSKNESLVFNK